MKELGENEIIFYEMITMSTLILFSDISFDIIKGILIVTFLLHFILPNDADC